VCGWSREPEPQDCLLAGGLLAAIASGWVVGVGAAVGMFVVTDVGALGPVLRRVPKLGRDGGGRANGAPMRRLDA